jgi:hypothetical protein
MPQGGSPSSWPKTYSPTDAPREVLDLAARLMPLLLAGDHPTYSLLREQYARAAIRKVELTGVGFSVTFEVPTDIARTVPAKFAGGNVRIEVEGIKHGAGCILFVRDGVLSVLDGYTYCGEEWPEHPVVAELRDSVSLSPPPP